MKPHGDRDRSVDHLLRQTLAGSQAEVRPGGCVDGETLAAWTDRALSLDEHAAVAAHLADCARCQTMLATLVRTAPPAPARESVWQRWQLRWLVPLATAATAVVVWTAIADPDGADRAAQPESVIAGRSDAPLAVPIAPPPAAMTKAEPEAPRRAPATGPVAATPPAPAAERPAEARAAATGANELRSRAAAPVASVPPAQPPAPAAEARLEDATRFDAVRQEQQAPRTLAESTAVPAEIVSPDGAHRWRIVSGTRVEYAASAGEPWTPVIAEAPAELAAGSSPAPPVCWIVGAGGTILVTADGRRFDRVPFVETTNLVNVTATSAVSATVTTADGRTFATTDRGRTWKEGDEIW